MADKGDGRGRPVSGRIKTLTQAALNADMTVEQVETLLDELSSTLVDLNKTTGGSTTRSLGSTTPSRGSTNSLPG